MADINDYINSKLIDSLTKINELIIANGQSIDNVLLPAIKKLEETQAKLGKNTKNNADERKKLTASEKEAARIAKQLETTEQKLLSLQKGQQDALLKTKVALQKETKAKKDNLKASQAAEGSLVRMRQKLSALTAAYDKTGNRTKAAAAEIRKLSERIGKAEQATNRHQRGVGSYGLAIKRVAFQLAGALGLTSALFAFINLIKGSFSTIRMFTKEQAVLAGVLGVTTKEVKALTDQAIMLGSIFPTTASEVTKLQVSLARLGFTQSEVLGLTEATITGSIAMNAELDKTATLVGATVRAFKSLGTEDSAKIIDILTAATQNSSLSFQSLEVALPKVAAAASAMGISLQTAAAHLGIAHDATLDASISGTSMRNIYLELAKEGITLSEALDIINSSSNKLSASFELFGKRGAVVGLALAENIDRTVEMTEAVDENGVAIRTAATQVDNWDGSIKAAASSWEKFILGFKGTDGVIKKVVDSWTLALNTFTNENISVWKKNIEIATFGFVGLASAEQKRIDVMTKNLSGATARQIQFTIDKHRAELENGNKTDKFILKTLEDRLVLQKELETKAAADKKTREESAIKDAAVVKLALEKESADKIAEERKKAEEKVNKEIEAERERHFNELRKSNEKFVEDAGKTHRGESHKVIKEEQERIESGKKLEVDKLKDRNQRTEDTIANDIFIEQTKKDQAEATKEAAIQAASELGNTLFDLKTAGLQREFDAAQGNAKKQAEISKKIAQQEKKKALFNIAINTAVAVVKALPNIPLSIIVGALGLASGIAVAAKPIPSFAKGVTNFGGGVAELAEQGTEMVKERSGKIWLAENRGLYNLQQGSTVLTAPQTQAELNDSRMVKGLSRIERAVKNQPRPKPESAFSARQRGYQDGYRASKHRLN